ncbi:MAG: L-ribulose-5-phosphate 3-epimerase [Eubacteriales bacterium]|nr:L-ribulose-5-phosphate 3-epimerase [Eubacteriales bacterium]
MKEYSLGLYEKSMPLSLSFEEKLNLTRDSGFDYMEISIDENDYMLERLDYPPEKLSEIRAAISNAGISMKSMCFSGQRRYPLGSHDPEIRRKSVELAEKAFSFSCDLGIRLIQLAGYDVYYEPSDISSLRYFLEGLEIITERAAAYGVSLGFETMETPFMDTVQKAMFFVNLIGSPYLGIYPDIGNLKNASVIYGHDVVQDISLGKHHILAAHLKETKPGVYRDMRFGSGGHTEYERCISELYRQGVRIFTGEQWYHGEENYKEILLDSSGFLRSKIESAIASVSPDKK